MRQKKLPDFIFIPFDSENEKYSLGLAASYEEKGVDFSVFVNEAIDITASYYSYRPNVYDFHGINYIRLDTAFQTYLHNSPEISSNQHDAEFSIFSDIYSVIVEDIYMKTFSNVEKLIDEYGHTAANNLRYLRIVGTDMLLTTR